jgi:site-specific DNA recombinase
MNARSQGMPSKCEIGVGRLSGRLWGARDFRRVLDAEQPRHTRRCCPLKGSLWCDICGRKMQAHHNGQASYYRCRFPEEYALANKVDHPGNIYVREADLLPDLDKWLSQVLAPHRIAEIIRAMQQAQMPTPDDAVVTRAKAVLKECATKLDRYRAALEDGNGSSTSIV